MPPPNTFEHKQTFFSQMFYYSFLKNVKNVFSIILRLLNNILGLVNNGYFVAKGILISTWKKQKLKIKNKNVLQKKFPEWIIIQIIDPICFIKMLWSIGAHWYFQKNIGSWLALGWSDTPQFTWDYSKVVFLTSVCS